MKEQKEGKKIKDIQINHDAYRNSTTVFLFLFNILLFVAVVYLNLNVNTWYISIIIGVILAYSWWRSIVTFLKLKDSQKYELFENSLKITTLSMSYEIDLSKVFIVEKRKSLMDKLFRAGSQTIVIYKKEKGVHKYYLHYVEEDAQSLCNEIMNLAVKFREDNKFLEIEEE